MSCAAKLWFNRLRIGMSPLEKVVGGYLAYRAKDETNLCWPSLQTVAHETEIPKRTVQRALAMLQNRGVITPAGMHPTARSIVYRVNVRVTVTVENPVPPAQQIDPDEDSQCGQVGQDHGQFDADTVADMAMEDMATSATYNLQENHLTIITNNEPTTRVARTKTTSETPFDDFWKVYPLRVGKGAAERAFLKCTKSVEPREIIAAVSEQIRLGMFKEGYIPHPATWLNRKGWLDEPPGRIAGALQPRGPAGPDYRNGALELLRREMQQDGIPPMIEIDPATVSLFGD